MEISYENVFKSVSNSLINFQVTFYSLVNCDDELQHNTIGSKKNTVQLINTFKLSLNIEPLIITR